MSLPQASISSPSLIVRWILAGVIGFAVGIVGADILTLIFRRLPGINEDRFVVYAMLLCIGLAIGFTQSRVIALLLPRPSRWIVATLIGYLLVFPAIGTRIPDLPGPAWTGSIPLLAYVGAVVGLAQWWLLRQRLRGAAWWIPASALGFLAFLWLVAHPADSMGDLVLAGALIGGLIAVPPALVLAWLARRPLPASA